MQIVDNLAFPFEQFLAAGIHLGIRFELEKHKP
jgi:hypothetical protein